METIAVEDAVGMVLCHDITEIIPGHFKGRAFKKGHIVQQEDISHLLRLGKERLYVYNLENGLLHENDAARRIARAVAGKGLDFTEPCEGRVNFHAQYQGLLKINVERLDRVNAVEDVVLATVHGNQEVARGRAVAGTRVVPIAVAEEKIQEVEAICGDGPFVEVLPFRPLKVGIVTTGSEVYKGRIKDAFGPVVRKKFEALGSTICRHVYTSDDVGTTTAAIEDMIAEGAEMVAVTGGMSVDPDDLSPVAIRAAGGNVITYGAPTFPGAMFMLAYREDIPIVGLPGCVMYASASIFDLIVPRIVAGDSICKENIIKMGHGGFCAGCSPCNYPVCPFGKR
ncbi:MAG: molybdopterin-binding protein [Desulfobacteraceae bacterium]|nr:molybdopterin-binding protein [Desulfobacteraceae bacterium]